MERGLGVGVEENLQVVTDFQDAFNARDWDRMMGFFSESAVSYLSVLPEPLRGPAAQREYLKGIVLAFPDMRVIPQNVFGQGDYVVYSAVETRARGAEPLGSATGQCTQHSKTGAKKVVLFCTNTFSLAGGQIVLAGAVVDEAKRNVVAVVGGTGSYRGARGQAVEHYIDDESSRWTLTFVTR